LELNSEISDLLPQLRNLIKIDNYDLISFRILNYYLIFKYQERTIDNLNYYFNILNVKKKLINILLSKLMILYIILYYI
jgi:hypothetical protein